MSLLKALQKRGTAGLILPAQLMGEQAVQQGGQGRARLGLGLGPLMGLSCSTWAQTSPRAGLKGGSSQSWSLLG